MQLGKREDYDEDLASRDMVAPAICIALAGLFVTGVWLESIKLAIATTPFLAVLCYSLWQQWRHLRMFKIKAMLRRTEHGTLIDIGAKLNYLEANGYRASSRLRHVEEELTALIAAEFTIQQRLLVNCMDYDHLYMTFWFRTKAEAVAFRLRYADDLTFEET